GCAEVARRVAEVLAQTVHQGAPLKDDGARESMEGHDVGDRAESEPEPSIRVLDLPKPLLDPAIPHRARRQWTQQPDQRSCECHVLLRRGKSFPIARYRASASASRRLPAAVSS